MKVFSVFAIGLRFASLSYFLLDCSEFAKLGGKLHDFILSHIDFHIFVRDNFVKILIFFELDDQELLFYNLQQADALSGWT